MSLINCIKREKRKRHEDVSHVLKKKPKNTMCVSVDGTSEDVGKEPVVSVFAPSGITDTAVVDPPPGFEIQQQETIWESNNNNNNNGNNNNSNNNNNYNNNTTAHTFIRGEESVEENKNNRIQKNTRIQTGKSERGGHINKYEVGKGKKNNHEKQTNGRIEKYSNKINSKKDLYKKQQRAKGKEKEKKEENEKQKKKKKHGKNSNDMIWEGLLKKDVILILVQAIQNMGYNKAAKLLEMESGIELEQPIVKEMHKNVLLGQWKNVIIGLKKLRINKKLMKAIGFLIYEQCFIEYLYNGKHFAALRCLRNKLAKCCFDDDTYKRLHECSTFFMYLNDSSFAQKAKMNFRSSRKVLFEKINRLLPETIIIPPRRLAILLHQSLKYQVDNCLFHNNFSDAHLIKQLLKKKKGSHSQGASFLQLMNRNDSKKKSKKKKKEDKKKSKKKNSSGSSLHKRTSSELEKSKKKKKFSYKYDEEDDFELKFDNPSEFAFLMKKKEDKNVSGTNDVKPTERIEGKESSKEKMENTNLEVGEKEKSTTNKCMKKKVKRKHRKVSVRENEVGLKENQKKGKGKGKGGEEEVNHRSIEVGNETSKEYFNEKKRTIESSNMNNEEKYAKKKSVSSENNNNGVNNLEVSKVVKVTNKTVKCSNANSATNASLSNVQKDIKNEKVNGELIQESVFVKKKKKHKKKKKGKEKEKEQKPVQNGCSVLGFPKKENKNNKVCYNQLAYSISLLKNHECRKIRLPYYCIKILHGHKDEVWYVSVSADGKYIASSSKDKSIILWKAKSPFTKLREWNGHIDGVSTIAWSHNSKYLLSGSNDSNVIIWTPKSNKKKVSLNMHSGPITSICWSQDDSIIISSGFDKRIYCTRLSEDMKKYYILYTWVFSTRIQNIVITNNDKYLIVAASDKNVRIFDFNLKTELYTLPEVDSITSICPSNLFNHILVNVGDQRPTIKLWDVKYRYIIQTYRGHKQGRFIVHSSFGGKNENYVISGSEDSLIYIWHKLKGYLLDIINGHASTVNIALWPLSYSKFPYMVSASDDHTLMIWNIKPNTRKKKKKLKGKKKKKQTERKKKKKLHPFLRELRHMSLKNKKE